MVFQRGSSGTEVERIQSRLKELTLYLGPVDGRFGGGTESAVKAFQKAQGLKPDGIVGPQTWARLLGGEEVPEPALLKAPVAQRCLALTGAFETGVGVPDCFCGLTGDFDGQGLSFGVLQWNLGQGSLQPLLKEMIAGHRGVAEGVLHEHLPELEAVLAEPLSEQLAWARSIQNPRTHEIFEPWRGLLKALGRTPEFQAIEAAHSARIYQRALAMCAEYSLSTDRGAALMFDILTQNGSISPVVKAQIQADFQRIDPALPPLDAEVERMRIVANRRAAAARAEFVEDVRRRKLCIAEGRGVVHGIPYDLEAQFGLRLQLSQAAEAASQQT